jgi:hypothetical protein
MSDQLGYKKVLARMGSDRGLAFGLFVLGVLSRVPFRSRMLYHWDSVNFALGMEQFDVRLHQPHPPGYLLYILLGRLVDLLVGDANASLVWISIAFGGLTVSVVYLLGRRLFSRCEAIISASFVLTSPAFWFYGEVALTYILEAFFVTAIALACLETLRGKWWMAFLSALLLGLAGGIRQTTLVLMLPLWVFSLRKCSLKTVLAAISLVGLTTMAWLVPTVILSGGVVPYLKASRAIGGGVLSNFELFGGGSSPLAWLEPFVRLGMYLVYGLMLWILPLTYGIIRGASNARTWLGRWLSDDRAQVVALWLIPNLALYAPLVRAPGHTFSFLPALVLTAAVALMMLIRDLSGWLSWPAQRLALALTSFTLTVNVAFFLAAPPQLFGIQRVVATTPSWPTIRYRDRHLLERVTYIKQQFDAATTLILTTGLDYRHPDYYLRDYKTLNYGTELLTTDILAGDQTLVFFGDALGSRRDDVQTVVLPSGGLLLYLRLDANSGIITDQSRVSVQLQVR